jgi:predicted aspartyl protease
VPEKYLDQIKTYRERYDHLPESERSIMLQKERELDQQRSLEEYKLLKKQEKEALTKHIETDVIIRGNQVLVPVTIGHGPLEQEALFLLDTGATHLVLFKEFANQFSIEAVEKGLSKVAGGGLVPSELVVLDYVKVGPLRVNQANATVIANVGSASKGLNFSGLLGMNILRNIEYTIDFENKKIRWKPKS